jgi:hypothetical protein
MTTENGMKRATHNQSKSEQIFTLPNRNNVLLGYRSNVTGITDKIIWRSFTSIFWNSVFTICCKCITGWVKAQSRWRLFI